MLIFQDWQPWLQKGHCLVMCFFCLSTSDVSSWFMRLKSLAKDQMIYLYVFLFFQLDYIKHLTINNCCEETDHNIDLKYLLCHNQATLTFVCGCVCCGHPEGCHHDSAFLGLGTEWPGWPWHTSSSLKALGQPSDAAKAPRQQTVIVQGCGGPLRWLGWHSCRRGSLGTAATGSRGREGQRGSWEQRSGVEGGGVSEEGLSAGWTHGWAQVQIFGGHVPRETVPVLFSLKGNGLSQRLCRSDTWAKKQGEGVGLWGWKRDTALFPGHMTPTGPMWNRSPYVWGCIGLSPMATGFSNPDLPRTLNLIPYLENNLLQYLKQTNLSVTTKLAIYMVLFHKRIMLGNITKQTEGVLTLNWVWKGQISGNIWLRRMVEIIQETIILSI